MERFLIVDPDPDEAQRLANVAQYVVDLINEARSNICLEVVQADNLASGIACLSRGIDYVATNLELGFGLDDWKLTGVFVARVAHELKIDRHHICVFADQFPPKGEIAEMNGVIKIPKRNFAKPVLVNFLLGTMVRAY